MLVVDFSNRGHGQDLGFGLFRCTGDHLDYLGDLCGDSPCLVKAKIFCFSHHLHVKTALDEYMVSGGVGQAGGNRS